MAKHYWTAFEWGAYLSKTAKLSLAEHGAYLLLMAEYYQTRQPLPANAEILLRICRAFADHEKAAVMAVLAEFFALDGEVYRNSRIDEELAKAAQVSEKRSDAGKKGAEKTNGKRAANAAANERQMPTQLQSQLHKEKNRAQRATSFPEGYQPNQAHKDLAISLGINLRESFPAFRDYHQSKGSTFKDWDAALRTWLRNERKFDKASPSRRPADILAHTTVSCDQCSEQFPVEHIGRHMTKNPIRQFCSQSCLTTYSERLVSA